MFDRKAAQRRLDALRMEAQSWQPQWKDLSRFVRPTRGFFGDTPNSGRAPDYKALIDGTSTRAARILGAGMSSGFTSRSRPWFKLTLPDTDLSNYQPVREWLDLVQSRMMMVFAKSNTYGVLHSIYEEIGAFATAASLVLEDYDQVIRGRNFTIGEYYLGTGSDGRVNTFGRDSWFTIGQLVQEFGINNVSEQARAQFRSGEVDQWVKVCHLIEPNPDRDPDKRDNQNMPFRSLYWEEASSQDEFLKRAGYEEFPVLAPRWDLTTTADCYGKGPGWDALGDIRMLQKLQRDKLIALDKLADPPVQADTSVQGEVNTLPGGVTRSNNNTGGIRPAYLVNPDLMAIENSIRATQFAIDKTFYTDLFLMLANTDRSNMTAKEVAVRHEEKLLMLGPVVERLEGELADPLIDRTYGIMTRNGLIPEAPPELDGMDLKVEYISILAQAQKLIGVSSMEKSAAFIGNLAGAKPEVLDVYDFDQMAIEYGEVHGLPPRIIRGKEKIEAIRKQREQAQAAAQQQQNAMAMVQGAKVLSDTQVGGSSALDALLGTTGAITP